MDENLGLVFYEGNTEHTKNKEQENYIAEVEVIDAEETPKEKLPSNVEQYRESLEKNGFYIIDKKLYKLNGKKLKVISNFIPVVEVRTIKSNGTDMETTYRIKPVIIETGQELSSIEVSRKDFESFKFVKIADWGWEAIAEKGSYDDLRIVAQILAKDSCEDRRKYTCTGFKEIEDTGEIVYLYDGGSITKNGDSTEIKADLSEGNLKRYSFTDKVFQLPNALNTVYSLLKMGVLKVMVILIAYVFLTPLTTFLQKINFPFNFCLFLKGRSGTGKSETAAILNSFWRRFYTNKFWTFT